MKSSPRRIGSIEVGFRIIRVLEKAEGALPLKELSKRAGMSPSKAYAYVASFVHEGLLLQDSLTGRYGLGPFAMSIGVAALRQSELIDAARRDTATLSEETTCAVSLSTWGNRGATIVHRVDGKLRGPTSARVGYVVPLWRSATGRVFLAHLPASDTATLLAQEEGLGFDSQSVTEAISRVRADGFALTAEGSEFAGVAAPILGDGGHIVAVLTLSRPFSNNTAENRGKLAVMTQAAAASIAGRFGQRHYVEKRVKPAASARARQSVTTFTSAV
jgi:DNA-binding IclR family transcriptional regulator